MILRPMAGGLHRIEIFVGGEMIGVKKVARMGEVWAFFGCLFYQRNLFPRQKKAA
jgi:hypothetical protein